MRFVNRQTLLKFLGQMSRELRRTGRLYLIGETSLVYEGWRSWSEKLEFTVDLAPEERADFSEIVNHFRQDTGIRMLEEHPGDLIPLPDGYRERSIRIDYGSEGNPSQVSENGKLKSSLEFYHFDPYSVAFRYIARGDEQDYHLVLAYLEHGWVKVEKMDALLTDLLPRFSFDTIQQDPAEFRRKYKGLMQMWRSVSSIL